MANNGNLNHSNWILNTTLPSDDGCGRRLGEEIDKGGKVVGWGKRKTETKEKNRKIKSPQLMHLQENRWRHLELHAGFTLKFMLVEQSYSTSGTLNPTSGNKHNGTCSENMNMFLNRDNGT
ncbi:hypothetical protein LINPERPRIM_LOCUS20777 [Linum perenne]